jgi:hypothetical protein
MPESALNLELQVFEIVYRRHDADKWIEKTRYMVELRCPCI